MTDLSQSLVVGLKRRGWRAIQLALAAVGGAWLITEIADFIFPAVGVWVQAHQAPVLAFVVIGLLLTCLVGIYEARQVSFTLPTTNTNLTIKFGDLFDQASDIVVSVNEFFDGQIGQVVAAHSVHGQFVVRYFQSDAQAFRGIVDPLLPQHSGQQVVRQVQPNVAYPIGTTVRVTIGAHFAYLVALTQTDPQTHKASSDISKFWIATTSVLEHIYHLGNGKPVALPLLGNGQASLNLPAQQILRLLVLAIVNTARRAQLPNKMSIILHPDCFEHVDLREIRESWRS